MVESLPLNLAGLDDEDLTQDTSDQADSLLKQESLLNKVSQIGATAAAIVPAGLDALDDRIAHEGSENENGYVETPMNSDGFFADSGDQVIFALQSITINYPNHYLLLLSGLLSEGGGAHQATNRT